MFGDQYDIFHARFQCRLNPLFRVNGCRIITRSRFRPIRPLFVMERIDTKMDKHSILPSDLFQLRSRRPGRRFGQQRIACQDLPSGYLRIPFAYFSPPAGKPTKKKNK